MFGFDSVKVKFIFLQNEIYFLTISIRTSGFKKYYNWKSSIDRFFWCLINALTISLLLLKI